MAKKLNVTYKINGKPNPQKIADSLVDLYERNKREHEEKRIK